MKKIHNYLLTLAVGLLLLGGCKEEDISNTPENESVIGVVEQTPITIKDQIAYDVAQRLTSAIALPEVRTFIKTEAIKQVDGDYDILFLQAITKSITVSTENGRSESITFGELLEGKAASEKNARKGGIDIERIKREYPLLQITVANLENANAETWNPNQEVPLIAYEPDKIRDDILPAYDTEGKYVPLSATTPPNQLVVVVSHSERIMKIDRSFISPINGRACPLEMKSVYEDGDDIYVLRSDYFDAQNNCRTYDDDPPKKPSQPIAECDRDRKNKRDRLNKFQFGSLSTFRNAREGWFNNDMEIELRVTYGTKEGGFEVLTKAWDRRETDFKDCGIFSGCHLNWVGLDNVEVINWNKEKHGDKMKYDWIEWDGSGGEKEISGSFTTKFEDEDSGLESEVEIEYSYKVTQDDYDLKGSIVEYCDNTDGEGYLYNTGRAKFYVRQ